MPIKANQTPVPVAAFTPAVDVAADHTVGVRYYDFRANTASPGLPTDYLLVHSHVGGASWDPEPRITPTSFEMESAPDAFGYFVGDYEDSRTWATDSWPSSSSPTSPTQASRPRPWWTRRTGPTPRQTVGP